MKSSVLRYRQYHKNIRCLRHLVIATCFCLSGVVTPQDSLELVLVLEGGEGESFGTSLATTDLNGDAYDDFIVGAPDEVPVTEAGKVHIYLNTPILDSLVDYTIVSPDSHGSFGKYVADAGDVNGDGYNDILVASPGVEKAYVYWGGLDFSTESYLTINAPDDILLGFPVSMAGLGDVNGDGYDDFAIGDWSFIGRAFVYFGGNPSDSIPDLIIRGSTNEGCGLSVAGPGDVNGDGYNDVLVGFPYACLNPGIVKIRLYYGGIEMDDIADKIISDYSPFGVHVSGAGDVNNDGFMDFMIGLRYVGNAQLYFGGSDMDTTADWIKTRYSSGMAISTAGDLNQDGFDDFMVSNPQGDSSRVDIYCGGIQPDTIPTYQIYEENAPNLGIALALAEDNKANSMYILASSYSPSTGEKRVYIYSSPSLGIVEANQIKLPQVFELRQNHPNPFNSRTTITYSITSMLNQKVSLRIYDLLGNEVRTLINSLHNQGTYRVVWDGKDDNGRRVPSGIYFLKLEVGHLGQVRKVLMIR